MTRVSGPRLVLSVLGMLTLAVLLGSAKAPRPSPDDDPPPVPKFRTATGTVMLSSDFRKPASLDDWAPDKHGVWTLHYGALRARLPDKKQNRSFIYAGSESWSAYAVDLDVCQTEGVDKGVAVRVRDGKGVGVDLRGPGYHDVLLHVGEPPLLTAPVHNDNGIWHHLRVEALHGRYRVLVDGKLVLDKADPRHADRRGKIGLAAYTGGTGRCIVYYGNVVVTALH